MVPGRLVQPRLISDDRAIVHPTLEERPPIGGRKDVAVWRQAVTVAVVIMQGAQAIAGPVRVGPRLRRSGSQSSKDENRECNQSHLSHNSPPQSRFVRHEFGSKA